MHLNACKYGYISWALPAQNRVIYTSWIIGIYCREVTACPELLWLQFLSVRFIKVVSEVGKVWIDSWKSLWNKERFFQPAVTWSRQFDMDPHHSGSEQCSAFGNRNSNKPLPFLPAQFTGKIFWLVWRLGFLGFFSYVCLDKWMSVCVACMYEREEQKLLKVDLKKLVLHLLHLRLNSIINFTNLTWNFCTVFNETCTFNLEVQGCNHYF